MLFPTEFARRGRGFRGLCNLCPSQTRGDTPWRGISVPKVFALAPVTQEKSSPKEPHAQPSSRCFASVEAAERPRGCPEVLKTTHFSLLLRASPQPEMSAGKSTGFRSPRDLPRTARVATDLLHTGKSPLASRGSLSIQHHDPVLPHRTRVCPHRAFGDIPLHLPAGAT